MEEYMQEQGIEINIDNVEKNDGLRYVIKLFLNSLWGRFAMRMGRVRAEVVTKRSRFVELLSTKSLQVIDITIINEKAARITYRYRKQFEREDENSNLVIASFTTAYGRLELFEYLRKTDSTMPDGTPHAFGLYFDTDSVCFVEHENYPAITPGRYLGQMKDEFPGQTIEEVICAGNKQYAIVLSDNDTGELTQKIKCKGFTQNSETCKVLTVENMRRMVLATPDDPVVLDVPVDVFEWDEKANVSTRRSVKRNKIAYRKSWIHERRIYPYGYNPPPTIARAWSPCASPGPADGLREVIASLPSSPASLHSPAPAEVYYTIIQNLRREDLDTLLVTTRQLGSLSRSVSRGRSPRPISLTHVYTGYFDLRFGEEKRFASFTKLPQHLEGSQLTDVRLGAVTLDTGTLQALTKCKPYFNEKTRLTVQSMHGGNPAMIADAFTNTLVASRMHLHYNDRALIVDFLTWPGVKQCTDLRVTLSWTYLPPESFMGWLVEDKDSTGPLRLCAESAHYAEQHDNWEASAQRLLLSLFRSDRRFAAFTCELRFSGTHWLPLLANDYQLTNTATGQKFDVKERTCARVTGFFQHTLCISNV